MSERLKPSKNHAFPAADVRNDDFRTWKERRTGQPLTTRASLPRPYISSDSVPSRIDGSKLAKLRKTNTLLRAGAGSKDQPARNTALRDLPQTRHRAPSILPTKASSLKPQSGEYSPMYSIKTGRAPSNAMPSSYASSSITLDDGMNSNTAVEDNFDGNYTTHPSNSEATTSPELYEELFIPDVVPVRKRSFSVAFPEGEGDEVGYWEGGGTADGPVQKKRKLSMSRHIAIRTTRIRPVQTGDSLPHSPKFNVYGLSSPYEQDYTDVNLFDGLHDEVSLPGLNEFSPGQIQTVDAVEQAAPHRVQANFFKTAAKALGTPIGPLRDKGVNYTISEDLSGNADKNKKLSILKVISVIKFAGQGYETRKLN